MRLAVAELLGMRRRLATYVVLITLLVLMGLVYLAIGWSGRDAPMAIREVVRFPAAYNLIQQLVFGLGSLLAVAYAAAVAGGDWTWGVPRLLIARGESRARYVLSKALAVAMVLAIGVLIAFSFGIVLNFLAAAMAGVATGNPLAGDGPFELARTLALGYPVLLERALIGFAVAIVLRSQLAGVVIGILLYIGEGIVVTVMLGITLASSGFGGFLGGEPIGPEWYQYLPFTVGDYVINAGASGPTPGGGLEDFFLRPVPLEQALVGVFLYGIVSVLIAALVVERAEITA